MKVRHFAGFDPEGVRNALGDARSVLLLDHGGAAGAEACSSLLGWVPPAEATVLTVTLDDTVDERVDAWESGLGGLPDEGVVIAVGEGTRSASPAAALSGAEDRVHVETVADPSDLTGLAMATVEVVEQLSESSSRPMVCFQSLSTLLLHADEPRVFRFLQATIGRLNDAGARSHVHLNPDVHEEATINRFTALVDAVVRVEPDGAVRVRAR